MRPFLVLILGIALATSGCGDSTNPQSADPTPGPGQSSTPAQPSTPVQPSPTPGSVPPTEEIPTQVVYYVGPGPDGPDAPAAALYRYDERGPAPHGQTILDWLTVTPSDPDYRTFWSRGSFHGVGDPEVGISVVELDESVPLHRPPGMSELEAGLAVQQVAWTVREYYSEKPDVKLVTRKGTVDRVFGVPTDGGIVRAAPDLSVLSHVSITEPAEDAVVSDPFVVRGLANAWEGTIACYLDHPSGSAVWSQAAIAGWQGDHLYPFEVSVDLTAIPSGTYTLRCSTDDPTAGTEGRGSDTDTRTVVVDDTGNAEPLQAVYYIGLTQELTTSLFRCLEPNDTGEPNHGTGWWLGQLTSEPTDPAYWTWWRRDTFTGSLETDDDVTTVEVRDASYVRRRRSMSDADARLALQQLAWTLDADAIRLAAGSTNPEDAIDSAFGIDVSQPVLRHGPRPQAC